MRFKTFIAASLFLPAFAMAAHQKYVVNSLNIREIVIVPDSTIMGVKDKIQEAVETLKSYGGGTVYLSAGVYKIENVQNAISLVNAKNIVFRGDGAATEFRAVNTGGDGADAIFFLNNCANIKFLNLNFKGLVLPQSDWGNNSRYHAAIQINGSKFIDVIGSHFSGFYTGGVIMQGLTTNSSVLNCSFDGVDHKINGGDYGAVTAGYLSRHITISQNHFTKVRFSAIAGVSASEMIITDNEAEFDPASGYSMGIFFLLGIQNSVISNNRFLNPANEGIVITASNGDGGISVSNNTITGNVILAKYAGININLLNGACNETQANYNIISNNIIYGTASDNVDHGVFLANTHFTNVSNNIVAYALIAIDLNNCPSHTNVTGNQIDASPTGIRFFGGGSVIGNIINGATSGITYGYITNATIQHNIFTSVTSGLVPGQNSSAARLGDNQ